MKKILLATTALVAFAGAASAEVSLSGFAEMGIAGGTRSETIFHNGIDIKFSLSGETDGGLTFGATIDLDEVTNNRGSLVNNGIPAQGNDASVFISGGFGTLTLGDTDGALDWAMQEVGIGSALTDDHTAHAGFNSNSGFDGGNRGATQASGQVLRYNNTFGDFGVALSAELDDSGLADTIWGLGVKYNTALGGVDLALGLAYQDAGPADVWGLSVDAKFNGGIRAILNYSKTSVGALSVTHTGVGVGYTMDALTVSANWGQYDPSVGAKSDGYGFAVNYDLGGGAVAQFGYGSGSTAGGSSINTWSAGMALSF
ncbi:hypothetical protein JI58_08915 [Marinosulfonomonas sp. PRT-SC04]|nr:hypothetical protein JI58_08915 [Marinosulfonomonas sp. PRT-SC04]